MFLWQTEITYDILKHWKNEFNDKPQNPKEDN